MASKQRRKAYTVGYKLEVIEYAKQHGNRAAERHFGPPPTEKIIREWRKQEEELKKTKNRKHGLRYKEAKFPQLEEIMKTWVDDHRNNGYSVSTKMIMEEAKRLAAERNIPANEFTGSSSWCYRFMKRNNLSMRVKTRIAQKLPAEYKDKVLEFHKYMINARKEINYEMGQIGNMDEVPLTFDVPSNKSVENKGAKTVTIKTTGHEKSHFTVVLACCADGRKLTPLLIFKRKTMPKDKIPAGVLVHVHPKGWMDEAGVQLWLEKVWSQRPGGLLKKPALLVWDQFRAHTTEATKKKLQQLKTKQAVIPGGLTSQLQPLDVCINKPFKGFVREEWGKWMAAGNHDVTPTGRIKRPSITQVCEWVKTSWDAVKEEVVVRSFKKCGISNAMDGTEDEFLYEDRDADVDDPDSSTASDSSNEDSSNDEFTGFEDQ